MRLHLGKVWGLGAAFELSSVINDDCDATRAELNWRVYFIGLTIAGSFPVTNWRKWK